MKIAIYVFLFSLCIITEPVKAKILTAEGRGVSEAIAKANAYRLLSEQVAVSIESAFSSVSTLNGKRYGESYFDKTLVSSNAQFAEVHYETVSSDPEFLIRISVDTTTNIKLNESRLDSLTLQLDSLLSQASDLNVLRQLMGIAQQYQQIYEQQALLYQIAGETFERPSALIQKTNALNQKFQMLDKAIQLNATAVVVNGESKDDAINRALKLLSQQLGVEVLVSTESSDTLIGDKFVSEFSDLSSIRNNTFLLGVILNEVKVGEDIEITASIEPRKVLPIYTEKLTEFIKYGRRLFTYPVPVSQLIERHNELNGMKALVDTAAGLAAFSGINTLLSEQDRVILDVWQDIIRQSAAYWRNHQFEDLTLLSEFVRFDITGDQNVDVCSITSQSQYIDHEEFTKLLVPVDSVAKSGKKLVWFVTRENDANYLTIRQIENAKMREHKIQISDSLIKTTSVSSSPDDRLLVNIELQSTENSTYGEEFFYADLQNYIQGIKVTEIVYEHECLPISSLSDSQLQQIYNVNHALLLSIYPQIDVFAIPNSNVSHTYAMTELHWQLKALQTGQSQTFTTEGKKFPAVDHESSIKEAFINGVNKAQKRLSQVLN